MRRPGTAADADSAALVLDLRDGQPPTWRPRPPRGGWTLDAAERAALDLAPADPALAARAYGILVRAVALGRLDAIERLGGRNRARLLRGER